MNAFAAAQARYDAMTPDDDGPDFRENVDVAEWMTSGIEALLDQGDVEIPNAYGKAKVVATHPQLVRLLVDHMAAQQDQTCAIEQILIEIIQRGNKDDRLHKLAIEAMGVTEGFDTVIHALAVGLLETHAEAYLEAQAECLALEAKCGF
jgi:hypothetical protein